MALSNEIDLSVEQLPQNPIVLTPLDEADYNNLANRPKINNVGLEGDKTSSELGLASAEQGEKADSAVQPSDLSVYRTATAQDVIDSSISTAISTHASNTSNPHSVTKAQVGLGNVDNTADLDKPISTATQTALNAKQDTLVSGTNIKTVNGNSLLGSGNVDIDALPSQTGQSGKFLTTNGTDASWANVDALPSQTGNQGKYLTTDGSSASWDIPMAGLPMFYATYQPRKLNNASWLRADPYSWHSADVYVSAYAHLADNISGVTAQTETIAGTTVTYYRLSDEIKVVLPDQQTNLDAIYNATGIGYYFILDTTNQRFKLPRNMYGFTGLRTNAGDYVPESLPNITGSFGATQVGYATGTTTGAFSAVTTGTQGLDGGGLGTNHRTFSFNATSSNSVYQNNAPVQQRATQAYLYFYVGNTVQNETTVDVAEMTEAINDKVDLASSWGAPSSNVINFSQVASNDTLTMPADGYMTAEYTGTHDFYNWCELTVVGRVKQGTYTRGANWMAVTIPVRQGDVVNVSYDYGPSGTFRRLTLTYAQKTN